MTHIEKPDFKKVKNKALELLDRFGYLEPPIDPIKIAQSLGISIYFAEFADVDKNISGFFNVEDNSIFVNKDEYPPRQIFTVAHELGHKMLHEDWLKSSNYKVLMRDQFADVKDPFEQEANSFAGNLLVPKFMLDKYRKIASVSELAILFAVSEPVIQIRLRIEYGR